MYLPELFRVEDVPQMHALIRTADAAMRIVAPDETPPRRRVRVMRQSAERDDACALLFTSGTTGAPKSGVSGGPLTRCAVR